MGKEPVFLCVKTLLEDEPEFNELNNLQGFEEGEDKEKPPDHQLARGTNL